MPSSPSSSPSSSLLQPLSSDPADFAAARDVLPPSPPDAAATSNLLPAGWLDTQPDRQGRLDQNDHTLLSTERVRIDSSPDDLPNSSTKPKVVPWRWSCEACRHRKIKCDGVRPACGFCLKRNITPCVFLGNKSRVDECLASKHKAQIDKRAQRKAALEAHAQAKRANAIARKASARLGTNNVKVVAVAKPTDVTGPPTSVAVASTSSWKRLEDGLDDDERAGLKMGHRNHSTGGGAATVESNRSRDDNESSPELMVELGSSPAAAPVSSSRSSSFLLSESDSHNCQSLLPVSSIKDLEILLRSFTLNPAFNSHDEAKRPPTRTKLVRPGSMDGEERMLAESFFELPLPVTFVHRKTFLDNLETSSLVLRAAICAVSAGLQWKPIMSPADANWYSETARQLAKESFDEPAIETVQALLIMGYVTLRFASEAGGWQLLGIACRMAQFLELNVNPDTLSSLSWVEKETRRRCWAACYLFDRICATLRGRLPIVKRDLGSLTPLCREDLWLNREDTSSLPSEYFNARSAMENVSNYVIRHSELLITCTELAYPACLAADTPVLTVIEEGVYRQIVSFEGELPFKYSYFVTGEWPKDHMEYGPLWWEETLNLFCAHQGMICVLHHRRSRLYLEYLTECVRVRTNHLPLIARSSAEEFHSPTEYKECLRRSLRAAELVAKMFARLAQAKMRLTRISPVLLYFALEVFSSLIIADAAAAALEALKPLQTSRPRFEDQFGSSAQFTFPDLPSRLELTSIITSYLTFLQLLACPSKIISAFLLLTTRIRANDPTVLDDPKQIEDILESEMRDLGGSDGFRDSSENVRLLVGAVRAWCQRRQPLLQPIKRALALTSEVLTVRASEAQRSENEPTLPESSPSASSTLWTPSCPKPVPDGEPSIPFGFWIDSHSKERNLPGRSGVAEDLVDIEKISEILVDDYRLAQAEWMVAGISDKESAVEETEVEKFLRDTVSGDWSVEADKLQALLQESV